MVSVLGDVEHGFSFQIRSVVVVAEDEAAGNILHRQVVDHERLADICERHWTMGRCSLRAGQNTTSVDYERVMKELQMRDRLRL